MAVLAQCWLIVECILIPNGLIKWFYLSFYIHPFFLFFCQIYLWIKTLLKWIFIVIFLLDRYIFSRVGGVLRRFLIIPRTFSGSNDGDHTEVENEELWYEVSDSYSSSDTTSGILFLCYEETCRVAETCFFDVQVESIDQETVSVCSSLDLDDEGTSFSGATSLISSYSFASHREMEVIQDPPSSSPSALTEDQVVINNDELADFPTPLLVIKSDEEKDSFYKLYTERMNWFDLLNEERTYGLNAFLAKKEYLGGERRIVKSLECDIEMVYVAQTCLSWEALHDQYRKLEGIIVASFAAATCTSSPYGALCSSTLVTKFQRFQILIERFMEDEISEKGKRYLNFIQKRSSLKSLLQVPKIEVSENAGNEKEGWNGGLMIRATDVLKTVEKCMKTFKSFIEVDEKKPWWRSRNRLSWSRRSPLEDPRDLNHLHDLTRTLRQKEVWMKDLKGEKGCWLRKRVKSLEDGHKKEMMFAMIELKLVSRVLMMSVISTAQLHWCQQKLDNIQINHGRITRLCTASLLFPPS